MKLDINTNGRQILKTVQGTEVSLMPQHFHYYEDTFTQQLGYKDVDLAGSSVVISAYTISRDFEPCENFNYISYNKAEDSFLSFTAVYRHKTLDLFVGVTPTKEGWDFWKGTTVSTLSEDDSLFLMHVFYKIDDKKELDRIQEYLNNNTSQERKSFKQISIVLQTPSGFTFKKHNINPLSVDIDTMYNDDFGPVYDHIEDSLMNTNKGIVLLHGDPGTGKTNLIKHLTTRIKDKQFVFIPVTLIGALADPSFIGELIDNRGSILVLEDCENYIKDRKDAGNNNVVSTILNITDGMLSDILDIQIICTFNNDIGGIDEALLRDGRLIAEYKFEALNKDKASKLMGEELEEDMTLAEIFNKKKATFRNKKETIQTIGFGK